MTKRRLSSLPRTFWPPEHDEILCARYPVEKTEALAVFFGRTERAVYQRALKLGLRKAHEYLATVDSGRIQRGRSDPRMAATQFKPGQQTWNKGVKGICGTHENCVRTQFKAGRPASDAHNYQPIGTERLSKDGYLERKVTDDPNIVPSRRWVGVHRLVWEAENGPVPCGHVVCFLPGRRSAEVEKITLDALELVHRGELARRNHPRSKSPELGKLVQLKGAITRQVNRIAREAKEQA